MAINLALAPGQRWRTRGGHTVLVKGPAPNGLGWKVHMIDDENWWYFVNDEGRYPGCDAYELDLVQQITEAPKKIKDVHCTIHHTKVQRDFFRQALEALQDADAARALLPGGIKAPSVAVPKALGDGLTAALSDKTHPYHSLAAVLQRAFDQAAGGKGKERHAAGVTPFERQPMATINEEQGSIDGYLFQARKKALESKRLPYGRDIAELLGAINYLAGAVIACETWAKKEQA